MGKPRFLALTLAIVFSLSGCGPIHVYQGNPKPNIDIGDQKQTLALAIDEDVKDKFDIPGSQGIRAFQVEGWHGTLKIGFKNGFSEYFELAKEDQSLTIRIRKAELVFAPTAVNAYGQAAAAVAQVTYQARLLDSSGNILKRSSDTVSAKKAVTDPQRATDSAAEAVESM